MDRATAAVDAGDAGDGRPAAGAVPLAMAWRGGELAACRSLAFAAPDPAAGAGGALLTTACAIPIAWLGVRYPRRLFRLLEGCNYITSSLPGIVTALALVTVTIHYARPVYQTEVTLFLAYLLMFMPRALINLRAGIAQAPVELENDRP